MKNELTNARAIAGMILLLGFAAAAAYGATLKGRVLDRGLDDPTGIAAVTVTAYDATDKELGHTEADADGNYLISGLPTGAVRVKFDRPGYVAHPTWRALTLTDDVTSEDVPMLQESGSQAYIVGMARKVAAQGSSASQGALQNAWQEFDQFQLPADVRQQLKHEVIELAGPQAAPYLEDGPRPPGPQTNFVDKQPDVGISPTVIGPAVGTGFVFLSTDQPSVLPAGDPANPAGNAPGTSMTASTGQKANPMSAEQGPAAGSAKEEKTAPKNAEDGEASPPPAVR
jgi:hypothetical protein